MDEERLSVGFFSKERGWITEEHVEVSENDENELTVGYYDFDKGEWRC